MIVYASRTGNVRSIVSKLGIKNVEINDGLFVKEPFFIFTYTDGLGNVPKVVNEFMENNHGYCKGVIASGNTNFGDSLFCASADKLSKQYGIPIIHKVEIRGFKKDYEYIAEKYKLIIGEE